MLYFNHISKERRMYVKEFVALIFSEYPSDAQITLFNFWHFFYLFVIFGGTILLSFLYIDRSKEKKDKLIRLFAYLTIGLYVADFFIMPLSDSYGSISEDKLPFHICTLMAVLVPFVQFSPRWKRIKVPVITLSIASSLMWMCYPGSALGGEPPFCYRIWQTFLFHGILFCWGVLNLSLGAVKLDFSTIWKEFVGILLVFAWASFGNTIYDGHNWFFLKDVLFPFIPVEYMPIAVIVSVFAVCLVIYGAYYGAAGLAGKKKTIRI